MCETSPEKEQLDRSRLGGWGPEWSRGEIRPINEPKKNSLALRRGNAGKNVSPAPRKNEIDIK